MKQVICQRCVQSVTISNWTGFGGHFGVRSAESQSETPWAVSGTFRKLRIQLPTAPGSGKSWTITVRKNGADTAMVVTIADTATEGEDFTNEVTVSPGDYLALRWVATNTPAATGVGPTLSVEFEGDNANESGYAIETGPVSTSVTRRTGVFWTTYTSTSVDTWNQSGTASDFANIVPTPGNITGLYARLNASPGGGSKGYEFAIYLNGTKQDGSGGTVDTRVTCSGTTQNGSATFTLPVVAGDRVYTECTPLNSPNAVRAGIASRFAATTDGESIMGGWLTSQLETTQTAHYTPLHNGFFSSSSTEANHVNIGHPSSFTLSGLRVAISTAPGSGKSYSFTVRKNAATPSGGPTVTIADSDVLGSDLSHSVEIVDGDTFDFQTLASAGPPASTFGTWALVQSGVVTRIRGSFVGGENTTVNISRAVAWGLDGATNVHSEEGVHKVFGASSVTEYLELEEMATPPSGVAGKVRIYAEDDGAGKTRLMAIFGTGAAQQMEIEP